MAIKRYTVHATLSPEAALDLPEGKVYDVWREAFCRELQDVKGGYFQVRWRKSRVLGAMGIEVEPHETRVERAVTNAFYETWERSTEEVRRGLPTQRRGRRKTVGGGCAAPRRKAGRPRVLSYGGGIDSWALLLEAIRRKDKPDVVCFMDVGDGNARKNGSDPGEWLSTYRHVRKYVVPLCRKHGIEFVWLAQPEYPVRRCGSDQSRSLYAWLMHKSRIPVSGDTRDCTIVAKVERFEDWAYDNWGSQPVEVWIGFDATEKRRVERDCTLGKTNSKVTRVNRFPLVEWGMCRCLCEWVAQKAPYPVPRKSACVFCPYGKRPDWETFRAEMPKQFEKIVRMEARKMRNPTAAGYRLSIKGYRNKHTDERSKRRAERKRGGPKRGVDYLAPTIKEWLDKGGLAVQQKECPFCGAFPMATKATGNDYLTKSEYVTIPPRALAAFKRRSGRR